MEEQDHQSFCEMMEEEERNEMEFEPDPTDEEEIID